MNSITILVADDHAPTLQLLARVLCDEGYSVVCAQDGVEALSLVGSHAPRVVISDVQLPHMNGLVFTRELRERTNSNATPVFLCTASFISVEDQALATRLGVLAVFQKPMPITKLLQSVESALDERSTDAALV